MYCYTLNLHPLSPRRCPDSLDLHAINCGVVDAVTKQSIPKERERELMAAMK
jgi:hypothetical protein